MAGAGEHTVSPGQCIGAVREHTGQAGPRPVVRGVVANSWRRSAALGVSRASGELAPVSLDAGGLKWSRERSPLTSLLPVVKGLIGPQVTAVGGVFAVTDGKGTLIWLGGDRQALRRLGRINFVAGADWSEASTGTNAPGTALATGRPVQVIGPEHYNESVQSWSCVAAPVYDPDSGGMAGAVDITGHADVSGPLALALVAAAARALEGDLRHRWAVRDSRTKERFLRCYGSADRSLALLSPGGRVVWAPENSGLADRLRLPAADTDPGLVVNRHPVRLEPFSVDGYWLLHLPGTVPGGPTHPAEPPSLRVLGVDQAILEVDGRAVRLSPRHSELVLLLSGAAGGLTACQLAVELCEDDRSAVAVRAEVSRLRGHVGVDLLTSQPYRLTRPLRTDFDVVRESLAAGEVRRALEAYLGPLLPHSVAPGVVARRAELEQQLRGALVATGDPVLLRRWVDQPHGREDFVAWRALAGALPPGSPQRAAAVVRLRGLERDLGAGRATPSLPRRS